MTSKKLNITFAGFEVLAKGPQKAELAGGIGDGCQLSLPRDMYDCIIRDERDPERRALFYTWDGRVRGTAAQVEEHDRRLAHAVLNDKPLTPSWMRRVLAFDPVLTGWVRMLEAKEITLDVFRLRYEERKEHTWRGGWRDSKMDLGISEAVVDG